MPTDSGQPIDITNLVDLAKTPVPDPTTPLPEFEVKASNKNGDTPHPAQVLPPVEERPQKLPIVSTVEIADLSTLPVYGAHSTLAVDILRKQRRRKLLLRHLSRKHM